MRGVITDVGSFESLILSDNGSRYKVSPWGWQDNDIRPEAGMKVDFEVQGSYAIDVVPLSMTKQPERRPPQVSTERARRPAAQAGRSSSSSEMRWWGWVLTAVGSLVILGIYFVLLDIYDEGYQTGPTSGANPNAPNSALLRRETLEADFTAAYADAYSEQNIGRGRPERYAADYAEQYATQIVAGRSARYAQKYAEQIAAGSSPAHATDYTDQYAEEFDRQIAASFSTNYADAYAEAVLAGESPLYAHAYATLARGSLGKIYAEQIDAGHSHWYAYQYSQLIARGKSPTFAQAFVERLEASHLAKYATHFAALVDTGISPAYAHVYSEARFVYQLSEDQAREIAKDAVSSLQSIDSSVVLAMYSTEDVAEADRRASSVREMTDYVESGDMDPDRALALLNEIAPESSLGDRRRAMDRIVRILNDTEGDLTPQNNMQVANELTRLITGHAIDADQRIEAAREMVRLTQSVQLNAENASELMNAIAPEWSVSERRKALGYLAWQFSEGDWDPDRMNRTAEEGYRLLTGGEVQAERRIQAGIQLVGEGIKRYGGANYDDKSVDEAVALLQATIAGELTTNSASKILGIGGDNSPVSPSADAYDRAYAEQVANGKTGEYARLYASEIANGKTGKYAHAFADQRLTGYGEQRRSPEFAHAVAEQIAAGESEGFAFQYAWQIVDGNKSKKYAYAFARQSSHMRWYSPAYAHAFAEQIVSGKSWRNAHIVASASLVPLPFGIHVDRYLRNYHEQIIAGESRGYATTYALQMGRGHSEEYAHAYTEQIEAGDTPRYAHGYAIAHVTNEKDVFYAQTYAHGYAQTVPAGDSATDASAFDEQSIYAREIETDQPDWYAGMYAEQVLLGKPGSYASIYAEQIVRGKSEEYAHAYTEQIFLGIREDYAHAYISQIVRGKPGSYATVYAEQVVRGKSPEYAHAFAKQIVRGNWRLFAGLYAWVVDLKE